MAGDRAAVESFFDGTPLGLAVLDAALAAVADRTDVEVAVSASQVALRRRRGFAWVWLPGRYLRSPAADVVLSLALGHEDTDPRWKEVVHPSRRHWVHHLEVRSPGDVDDRVGALLREAAERAG